MLEPVDLLLLPHFVELSDEGIQVLGPELVDALPLQGIVLLFLVAHLSEELFHSLFCHGPHGHGE